MTLPIETIDKLILTNIALSVIALALALYGIFKDKDAHLFSWERLDSIRDLLASTLRREEIREDMLAKKIAESSAEIKDAIFACRYIPQTHDRIETKQDEPKRSLAHRFFYGDTNQGQ